MFSSVRRLLVALIALTTIGLTASSASAASAYITDPGYDTTSGGSSAQKAVIDLRRVTYWNTDTRFYVRWKVRDLTAISGAKQYEWTGVPSANSADYNLFWISTTDGDGVRAGWGVSGRGNFLCSGAKKTRIVNTRYNYVQVSVPRWCLPKGIRVSSPYGSASVMNSSYTTITADRTRTGAAITPH